MLDFKNTNISVGKTPILKNISVSFKKGDITTVIGPNGSGKTTLLQTLNGLSSVNAGEIYLDNEDYLALQVRERAKRLSFLPQFRENAPNISVGGLIEHGRFAYMGFSRKMSDEDKAAVENALNYTGMTSFSKKLVSELSGGLQQRAYLAMQIAQGSPYMVMDEPMNHLDFPAQREIYRMIRDLKAEGKTIILVLHDLNQALRISDNIIVMNNRKIVFTGTPKECLEDGVIKDVFECEIVEAEADNEKHYIFI